MSFTAEEYKMKKEHFPKILPRLSQLEKEVKAGDVVKVKLEIDFIEDIQNRCRKSGIKKLLN